MLSKTRLFVFYNRSLKGSLGNQKWFFYCETPFLFLRAYNMFLHIFTSSIAVVVFVNLCSGWLGWRLQSGRNSIWPATTAALLPLSFNLPDTSLPPSPLAMAYIRGAEINALMGSEPGGRHPIYHEKVTFAIPQRDCKQQTHCSCRCWMLGLKDKSGQGKFR